MITFNKLNLIDFITLCKKPQFIRMFANKKVFTTNEKNKYNSVVNDIV